MRSKTKLSRLITFISAMLCLLVISDMLQLNLQSVVSAQSSAAEENGEGEDESTCSLDPSTSNGDCTTTTTDDDNDANIISMHQLNSLTRQVIPLTDDNFDELTLTSTPATWLIMFKTNKCGICKKAKPVWDDLSMDIDIINHNERELSTIHELNKEQSSTEEKDKKPPVSVYEEELITTTTTTTTTDEDDNSPPTGPVYIATIDAGWSGKDTTLQFSIDATPTIILLRNKGYNDEFNKDEVDDPRSYYIYRGQRAIYPLRQFILGGYKSRKKNDMPPPLLEEERKPTTLRGRIYDYLVSSTTKWIGGIVGKVLLVWFVFIGGLGLFLRIHNYAWGDNADDDNNNDNSQREIEEEKAKGRKEYDMSSQDAQDERSIRRQKIMWERKAKNHEKFAANREARNKKRKEDGEDEDEMEGVGFSVKKKDAMKNTSDTKKKNSTKSNDN